MNLNTSNILKLLHIRGIGRVKVIRLNELMTFQPSNDRELADLIIENKEVLKLHPPFLGDLLESFEKTDELIELSKKLGINIFSIYDPEYPQDLKDTTTPPLILNIKGDISILNNNISVAVIGTREPSEYGRQAGEKIAYRLAEKKINVVSGLAKGCDTAAHIGSLKANGLTTAVLAHGLDTVYPAENRGLASRILESGGCLVSEYMIKTKALGNFFVERDRIQAGLSKSTIVIETDIKGGTMHTVNFTLEYKRVLAALKHPDRYRNDKSRGNEFLLTHRNAKVLETKDDIDSLIQLINPITLKPFFPSGIPIAEIQIPLFEDYDFNPVIKKETFKKPRKPRSKTNVTQLPIDKDVLPIKEKKARKKKKEPDISNKDSNNEGNI